MLARNLLRLITSLALGVSGAFLGALSVNAQAKVWFNSLIKPNYFPSNYFFIIISVILIIVSSLALYLAWKKGKGDKHIISLLFTFSLPLSFYIFWSFIFFYLQDIRLAFLALILMMIFLLAMMLRFYLLDRRTIYLLLPYLAWIVYIAYLNYALMILN